MNRLRIARLSAALIVALLATTGCDRAEQAHTAPAVPATGAAPAPTATAATRASTPTTAPARELLADAAAGGEQRAGGKRPSARLSATRPAATKPPPDPDNTGEHEQHYEYRAGSRDGIGKWYMGREIAHVMGHQAAGWLQRENREEEERPSKMIEILQARLEPDDVFADIGAGTGYYSFRVAPLVPEGKVLAVDIQQEMLDLLSQLARDRDVDNVAPILGTITDPKLPDGGVDWVMMVDAYHEFDHPREMMQAMFDDLRPGGQVILLEYRAEDPTVNIKECHKMSEAQAIKEMEAVGLKHVETLKDLPWQHVMFFEKPKKNEERGKSGDS